MLKIKKLIKNEKLIWTFKLLQVFCQTVFKLEEVGFWAFKLKSPTPKPPLYMILLLSCKLSYWILWSMWEDWRMFGPTLVLIYVGTGRKLRNLMAYWKGLGSPGLGWQWTNWDRDQWSTKCEPNGRYTYYTVQTAFGLRSD